MTLAQISDMLVTHAKTRGWVFLLRGTILTPEQVFADVGLLPALAKRAVQLSSLCFSYHLGLDFPEASNTSLGYTVVIKDSIKPLILLLCLLDVIEEVAKSHQNGRVALDELLYE